MNKSFYCRNEMEKSLAAVRQEVEELQRDEQSRLESEKAAALEYIRREVIIIDMKL